MKYFLSLILLWFQISAFGEQAPENNLPAFQATDTGQILRLAGSNTIGAELAPALAEAYLAAKGASSVEVRSVGENEYRVGGSNSGRSIYIDIKAHGSSTGFATLRENDADIAMSSRKIKDHEAHLLERLGDLHSFASEHVLAIDGVAIIVHRDNPIRTLSTDQLAHIFSGRTRNWKTLGGPDMPIRLLARDDKSGTWDTFKSLVLDQRSSLHNQAERYESNDELSDQVSQDLSAIGFVGLASVRDCKALAIIDGGTSPLKPAPLLVATEDYPLSRRLFLYTPELPQNRFTEEFVQFALTYQGQNIVEEVGFISQNPVGIKVAAEGDAPFYRTLATHAQRLSLNFRFQPHQAELDNKAKRDIMRLAEYLKTPENRKIHIQLIGFSDREQQPALAKVLSKLRASAVKRELYKHGVLTETVEGLGAARPIASTSTRNDRVEVWIYSPESALTVQKEQRLRADRLEMSLQRDGNDARLGLVSHR